MNGKDSKLPEFKPDFDKLEKDGAVEELVEALRICKRNDWRKGASEALVKIASKKPPTDTADYTLVQGLVQAIKDYSSLRESAVDALCHHLSKVPSGAGAIPRIAPLLKSARSKVQLAGIEVLEKIGDAKAKPLITPLLKDRDKKVRDRASKALQKLRPRKTSKTKRTAFF
ncbi:MAG: HEAT repeat domain-containing protein [Promethearchaeota archaeon]